MEHEEVHPSAWWCPKCKEVTTFDFGYGTCEVCKWSDDDEEWDGLYDAKEVLDRIDAQIFELKQEYETVKDQEYRNEKLWKSAIDSLKRLRKDLREDSEEGG